MSDETNYELLSAYLDGELPADERQRVERLISENAECRQVYEELCALRASLSSLPRHKVGEDLGPRVLRLAEEARLAGQGARGEAKIVPAGAQPTTRRAAPSWRAIVYPALAVAAAIAMLVTQSKDKEKLGRDIARAPTKPDPPAAMSAAPEKSVLKLEPMFAKDQLANKSEDADQVADESEAATLDNQADRSEMRLRHDKRLAKSLKSGSGASGPEALEGNEVLRSQAEESDNAQKVGPISKTTLVVNCKLAPLAARDKAFQTMLARNHLTPVVGPAGADKLALQRRAVRPSAPLAGSAGAPSATSLETLNEDLDKPNYFTSNSRDDRWSEMVMVEMDARQFVAVLNDLQNHPEQFLAIELATKPAAKAEQPASEKETTVPQEPAGDEIASDEAAADDMPADEAELDAPQASPTQLGLGRPDARGGMMGGMGRLAAGDGPERVRVLFRLSATPEK